MRLNGDILLLKTETITHDEYCNASSAATTLTILIAYGIAFLYGYSVNTKQ
jgi:hypothetical protein